MYVCLCQGITDHQIRSAVESGAANLRDVRKDLGVASQCGKCACFAKEVIRDHLNEVQDKNNLFFAVA